MPTSARSARTASPVKKLKKPARAARLRCSEGRPPRAGRTATDPNHRDALPSMLSPTACTDGACVLCQCRAEQPESRTNGYTARRTVVALADRAAQRRQAVACARMDSTTLGVPRASHRLSHRRTPSPTGRRSVRTRGESVIGARATCSVTSVWSDCSCAHAPRACVAR